MDQELLPFFIMDAVISLGTLVFIFAKWSDDNHIYKIIRIIIVCYIYLFITIPGILDFKKAINYEYEEFTGIALNSSAKKRTRRNEIEIYNKEENVKVKVIIATPKIEKDNNITVLYLPYTKYAKVIEVRE